MIGLLCSCSTKEMWDEVYASPSGDFAIGVQIGDEEDVNNKAEMFFTLLDKEGDILDKTRTKASAAMNYAIFWYTEKTVTLYSSDIGVKAWLVSKDKKLLPAEVDSKMDKKAEEVFNKKLGR